MKNKNPEAGYRNKSVVQNGYKNTLKISGHAMAYLRVGRGEPVLLAHGITTYSFIWRKIIPILSKDYDVIAIDLLGCGDSDKPLDVSYAIKDHLIGRRTKHFFRKGYR